MNPGSAPLPALLRVPARMAPEMRTRAAAHPRGERATRPMERR
jgi:hypothetical protein